MTPTPCRVAGAWMHCIDALYHCILLGVRKRSCTYLRPTYWHSWRAYKVYDISETVEYRAKATINGLYKVVHWLSTAAKMYDLEW